MSLTLVLYIGVALFFGALLAASFEKVLVLVQAENPDASPRLIRVVGVIIFTLAALLWPLLLLAGIVARLARRG